MTDAIRAELSALIDHAPLFPPASLSVPDAIAEDRRARADEHAWLLARLVWPASQLHELEGESGAVSVLPDEGLSIPVTQSSDVEAVETHSGAGLDEVAATAGLHHPLAASGRHGFLNVLAACAFEDDAALEGQVELTANGLRWRDREAGADELARVRREQLVAVGSYSFFEPVDDLRELGIL